MILDTNNPMDKYIKGLKCQYCKHYFSRYCLNFNSASYDEFKYSDDYCYAFELRPNEKSYASFPAQYERNDGSYIFDPNDKTIDSEFADRLRVTLAADLRHRKSEREVRIREAEKDRKAKDLAGTIIATVAILGGWALLIYILWPLISDILDILEALGNLFH